MAHGDPPGSGMQRYTIVLCRVEGPANVGACCRAMKSMGVTELRLAECPPLDESIVKTYALSAFGLFEEARKTPDLASALADLSLAVGFSRRTGRRRKSAVSIEDLAGTLPSSPYERVALVFGNERDGLSDAELRACDMAAYIPSSPLFPSLNLSHAVQLACWELFRAELRSDRRGNVDARPAAPAGRLAYAAAAKDIADRLQEAGFYKIAGRDDAERFLRELAARAGMDAEELGRLTSMFRKLDALDRHRAGR